MSNRISILTSSGEEHTFSVDEYTRWLCLMEAIQHINLLAKNKNINLEENDNWIQPIKINKYIKERYPSLRHDMNFMLDEI